jgi:glucose/arabinose dehydrogenase
MAKYGRPWALALALLVGAAGCGSSTTHARQAIGAGLHGVAGTKATVYATGLQHAAAFAFDGSGRLWVATAAYSDTGHDGVYVVSSAGAKPVEVIANLHTPLGLLWRGSTLYVASKERVDAFTDLQGNAFRSRLNIVTLPKGVGESNGLIATPDGRILLGISSPCDACTPSSALSASIVSFRPDGTDLQVWARRIRAPIAFAYFPGTTDLFTTMNQRDDLGAQTPGDWLALVRQGQDWGFPACYGQGASACASTPQPTAVLDKHAAVSGVVIVDGQLGKNVGTAALVAEWATGKVELVSLARSASGYHATVSTFLTGVQNPVAVALTPHGSLLVGDWTTGTIYQIARS